MHYPYVSPSQEDLQVLRHALYDDDMGRTDSVSRWVQPKNASRVKREGYADTRLDDISLTDFGGVSLACKTVLPVERFPLVDTRNKCCELILCNFTLVFSIHPAVICHAPFVSQRWGLRQPGP